MSAKGDATALQVCVRFRPLRKEEEKSGVAWNVMTEYSTICETTNAGKPIANSGATFDKVYAGDVSTEEVYNDIGSPLVENAMNGMNATIFAYGQTSSGKTFTMQGDGTKTGSKTGFINMAAQQIFKHIEDHPDREFLLRLSYIEIYNEVIRDLLQPDKKLGTHLKIKVNPRTGPYVKSISEVVTDAASIMRALRRGDAMREVNATDINERSSRSHTIFKIMVESKERSERRLSGDDDVDGAILESHLNLVDLAGSENVRHTGAEGTRLKEAGNINKSLLTLSRVIKQIGSGAGHVNFRDSKLTHILQPSLAGNCKTALVACATPAECYREETRSTLAFAQRAKLIKTSAKVNETLDEDCQLRRMKKDLRDARRKQKQMEAELSAMQSGKTQEELSALRDALQETKDRSQQAREEKETADRKYENLKNLILSSVMNAGSRKRAAKAMNAKHKMRRRHSMALPSKFLEMRGSDFTLKEDDAFDALGLISSVAAASPSLKRVKLHTEAEAASAAEADQESAASQIKSMQFKIDILESKVESHKKKMATQSDELSAANDLVTKLQSEIDEKDSQLETKIAELTADLEAKTADFAQKESALSEQVDLMQAENATFASQLEAAKEEKDTQSKRLQEMEAELEAAKTAASAAEENVAAAVEAQTSALQSELDKAIEAKVAAESAAEESSKEVESLKKDVVENAATSAELMATFEDTVTELEKSTAAQTQLSDKLDAAQKTIAELQSQQSTANPELEAQFAALQEVVKDHESKNTELMATFNDTVTALEEATTAKDSVEQKLQQLQSETTQQIEERDAQIAEHAAKIAEQANTNAELMATFDETVAQLEAVTTAKGEVDSQLEALTAEKAEIEAKFEAAQEEATALALNAAGAEEVDDLNKQITDLTAQNVALQEQISKLQTELKSAQDEHAKVATEAEEAKELNSVLQFEMKTLEEEKTEEEEKVKSLDAKVTEVTSAMQSKEQELSEANAARDEMSTEMEELTADLVAKDGVIKTFEEKLAAMEQASSMNANQVEEKLRLQQEAEAAKKELDELRMHLSAEKKLREEAEAANAAASSSSADTTEKSVALSNELQLVQQQITALKEEAVTKQITWAEREAALTQETEKAAAELVEAKQASEALHDKLNVATQELDATRAELAQTQEKLQEQVAQLNANVNEATEIQSHEEAARKVASQTDTANGLMRQELEKKEIALKEATKRVKELEGMMWSEQEKLNKMEEVAEKAEKDQKEKVAALEHEINRLRSEGSQQGLEQVKRLEFLEKQNANLTASSQANTTEVIENRKKVADLTAKCERYQQSVSKLDARCDELRDEIKEKDGIIKELERRAAEHDGAAASAAEEQQLAEANNRLKDAIAALERRVEKQKTEIAEANGHAAQQQEFISKIQEENQQLTEAAQASEGSNSSDLAQDLECALEQRDTAQKKLGELTNSIKKLRTAADKAKESVATLTAERDSLASIADEATAKVTQLENDLMEKQGDHSKAVSELATAREACTSMSAQLDALKAQVASLESAASEAAASNENDEKILELQEEIEFQNSVIADHEAEKEKLRAAAAEAEKKLQEQTAQYKSAFAKYSEERKELEDNVQSWTHKYQTHKSKALEQYESVANEAARLAAVEAELRAHNATLTSKIREQATMLRDQRNAIAQADQSTASAKAIEVLKQEVQSERARVKEQTLRIAKLEKVKLTNSQVEKLVALKKEHKQFKKENKKLRETVQNLTASSSSSRSSRNSRGSASNDQSNEQISALRQENEELRELADNACAERDDMSESLKKHREAAASAEKENAQLKDKLLRADVSFSEAYKEKEAQYLKEIKYLENENLELMEEIAGLREAAVQRDESVTLNIPSLTKFLADSPVADSKSATKQKPTRTPLAARASVDPNASDTTQAVKRPITQTPSAESSSAPEAAQATVGGDDDKEMPPECNTQ